MIILDTNVVSEAMKPSAAPAVTAWLDAQVADTLYLSSVTLAELLFGIAGLPDGRRRSSLSTILDELLAGFGGRVLPFDADAARCYANIAGRARRAGQGSLVPDGYIAATAISCGYSVATRDAGPFLTAGVVVIDPWTAT